MKKIMTIVFAFSIFLGACSQATSTPTATVVVVETPTSTLVPTATSTLPTIALEVAIEPTATLNYKREKEGFREEADLPLGITFGYFDGKGVLPITLDWDPETQKYAIKSTSGLNFTLNSSFQTTDPTDYTIMLNGLIVMRVKINPETGRMIVSGVGWRSLGPRPTPIR